MTVLPDAGALGVSRVVHLESTQSTMDVAHAEASAGALAGTLIVADEQTRGRGRSGQAWLSAKGAGIWFTLVERPTDVRSIDLLSVRLGLVLARELEPFCDEGDLPLQVKWPNDVFSRSGKLAGILVEARWREQAPDWVAIGIGINLVAPELERDVGALLHGVDRTAVLRAILAPIREACARTGLLTEREMLEWNDRDYLRGRLIEAPVAGRAAGVAPDGSLLVVGARGEGQAVRSGSVVLAPQA